jgi:hypothetical protein
MSRQLELPFDSIENAQEYIRLLAETVSECLHEIDNQLTLATDQMEYRRVDALRMVEYNLQKLQRQLSGTSRILNDLRLLRRLLHQEKLSTNGANSEFELARG